MRPTVRRALFLFPGIVVWSLLSACGKAPKEDAVAPVVTVDVAILSNRENNIRAGFAIPIRPTLRLLWDGITRPRWTFGTFLPTLARRAATRSSRRPPRSRWPVPRGAAATRR